MTSQNKKIFIVAGEASGDLWGSLLVKAMRGLDPEMKFFGIGLREMEREGVEMLMPPEAMASLSVAGGLENLGKVPAILRLRKLCLQAFKRENPRLTVLIDYPGFNLNLAKKIHSQKIPVIYYAPPQVWLWGKWRLKKLKRYCRKLLVFFPFEEAFYRAAGLDARWVGHPVLHWMETKAHLGNPPIDSGQPSPKLIGLLPGSRRNAIHYNLPPMLEAARRLHRTDSARRFVIPVAPMIPRDFISRYLVPSDTFVEPVEMEACQVLRSCASAIVVTGTAALEAAFCGVPFVLCGRGSFSVYFGVRYLFRIREEGIVNRLAGKSLVPELWHYNVTGPRLAETLEALLADPSRYENTRSEFQKIRAAFEEKGDASVYAAKEIYKTMINP